MSGMCFLLLDNINLLKEIGYFRKMLDKCKKKVSDDDDGYVKSPGELEQVIYDKRKKEGVC
jgi:hypothetical protein